LNRFYKAFILTISEIEIERRIRQSSLKAGQHTIKSYPERDDIGP